MVAANTVQPDTLADVKDEAKTFNAKLRRVLKDKSAKGLADLLKVKTQTVYQWKSRGFQLAPYQVPIVAKFAGCTVDYLCDNSIPVEADPTQGSGPTQTDEQVIADVRERYIKAATTLHNFLQEVQGTRWTQVARELLYAKPGDTPSPYLKRAEQLLNYGIVIFDITIGPFSQISIKPDSIDEVLRFGNLNRRLDGTAYASSVRLVIDGRSAVRGIQLAKRHDRDATGSYKLLEELRDELDTLEASGEHLLDTCAGVIDAGGIEAYCQALWKAGEQQAQRVINQGEEAIETFSREWMETGQLPFSEELGKPIMADMKRQSEYDTYAEIQALTLAGQNEPVVEENAFKLRILERSKERVEALIGAYSRYFAKHAKPK